MIIDQYEMKEKLWTQKQLFDDFAVYIKRQVTSQIFSLLGQKFFGYSVSMYSPSAAPPHLRSLSWAFLLRLLLRSRPGGAGGTETFSFFSQLHGGRSMQLWPIGCPFRHAREN